jgi:deoxycytidylate deaminase
MTCAKRRVLCRLITERGETVLGENECDEPQRECPRAPGEGYEKCRTVCKQRRHAEIAAIDAAVEAGLDLTNAVAYVYGHYYVCEHCARALSDAGVRKIEIVVTR